MTASIRLALVVGFIAALNVANLQAQSVNDRRTSTTRLTQAEVDWITLIRVDEKLARDTYLKLYELWRVPIFANIAASEQKHMDAVKTLIDKYGLPDPVAGLGVGEFPSEEVQGHDFQLLYEELVNSGAESAVAAYEVGVLIEELDIDHLTAAILAVRKTDVKRVFKSLRNGSYNHLAAFESKL